MVDRRKKLQREITFTLAAEMQTILTSEIPYPGLFMKLCCETGKCLSDQAWHRELPGNWRLQQKFS
jgi:hypothetical protein